MFWATCCKYIHLYLSPSPSNFILNGLLSQNTMKIRNNNSNYNAAVTIRSCAIFFLMRKKQQQMRFVMARTFHWWQVDISLHFYVKDVWLYVQSNERTGYMCAIFILFKIQKKIRKRVVKRSNFRTYFMNRGFAIMLYSGCAIVRDEMMDWSCLWLSRF